MLCHILLNPMLSLHNAPVLLVLCHIGQQQYGLPSGDTQRWLAGRTPLLRSMALTYGRYMKIYKLEGRSMYKAQGLCKGIPTKYGLIWYSTSLLGSDITIDLMMFFPAINLHFQGIEQPAMFDDT